MTSSASDYGHINTRSVVNDANPGGIRSTSLLKQQEAEEVAAGNCDGLAKSVSFTQGRVKCGFGGQNGSHDWSNGANSSETQPHSPPPQPAATKVDESGGSFSQQSSDSFLYGGTVRTGVEMGSFKSGLNRKSSLIASQVTVSNLMSDFSMKKGESKAQFAAEVAVVRKRIRSLARSTIDPRSRFVRIWDMITMSALLFTAFVTPFHVAVRAKLRSSYQSRVEVVHTHCYLHLPGLTPYGSARVVY